MQDPSKDIGLDKEGISAIIVPIMVPKSKRVEDNSIQMIFEMMMAFSLIDVDLDSTKTRPKVIIILNNFSTETAKDDSSDSDDLTGE